MSDTPSPVRRLKNGRIVCTVTFTAEQLTPAEAKAMRKLGEAVKIDGFRPGQAPAEILREHVSPDQLFEETVRLLLPDTFKSLTTEHEIKPIIPPKVEAKSRNPLTLDITFVEHPEVNVKAAEKIKIEPCDPKVDAKDIDRMIDYVLEQHQTTKPVDRAAKEGDRVTMDFWGEDDKGKEVEGIRTVGHQVILGSKSLIPGFEDALTGLRKDERKDFTLTFPKNYHAEQLQEKPVTFHVTVTQVEEVNKPQLTDAFVKEHLQVPTVEAFRTTIESSMLEQEKRVEKQRCEQELLEKIRNATKVDLAPELVEEEERDILESFLRQLEKRHIAFDDWLKQTGKKLEDVKEDIKKQADQRLTLRFGIQQLAEDRGVDLTDDEMEQEVHNLLAPLSEEERKRIEPMYRKDLQGWHQLKWQKRVEKLIAEMTGI